MMSEVARDIEVLEDQIALARTTDCASVAVPLDRLDRLERLIGAIKSTTENQSDTAD